MTTKQKADDSNGVYYNLARMIRMITIFDPISLDDNGDSPATVTSPTSGTDTSNTNTNSNSQTTKYTFPVLPFFQESATKGIPEFYTFKGYYNLMEGLLNGT